MEGGSPLHGRHSHGDSHSLKVQCRSHEKRNNPLADILNGQVVILLHGVHMALSVASMAALLARCASFSLYFLKGVGRAVVSGVVVWPCFDAKPGHFS